MDGKLVGRLSPGIHLTCRLSVTPRDGPAPVFIEKTVTENGTFRAVDEGADGYSEFTVDIHTGLVKPHFFDLSGGYVQNGVWTIGSDTVCYSDMPMLYSLPNLMASLPSPRTTPGRQI